MMKKKNIMGILTLVSLITLALLGFTILSQGINFSASLVQLSIVNLVLLVVLAGIYLVNNHCETKPMTKKIIWALGGGLVIFGAIVAFNLIDFKSGWNYLMGVGLLFVTLVQMQILDWEISKGILKILGLLTLLANIYMIAYFLFELTPESMGSILDIAVLVSAFAFLVGLIFYVPKNKKAQ
jgi:hypothetical protein